MVENHWLVEALELVWIILIPSALELVRIPSVYKGEAKQMNVRKIKAAKIMFSFCIILDAAMLNKISFYKPQSK